MRKQQSLLLPFMHRETPAEIFFNGRLYPLLVVTLVFVGLFTGYELFTNLILSVFTFVALVRCRTIRPLLPHLLLALYQIPEGHLIKDPYAGGDYLFSGWRLYLVFGSIALVLLGLIIFLFRTARRHSLEEKMGFSEWKPLPIFLPILLFCSSFLLAGFGTDGALSETGYLYAFGQIAVFGLLFFAMYVGLRDEKTEDFLSYFAYLSLLCALVLNVQVGLYHYEKFQVLGKLEFIRNHEVYPEITLGFGDCNLVACNVGTLIPMQLYGFTKCRGRLIYLCSALLTYVSAISCVCRSTLVIGTLVLLLGLAFSFFARDLSRMRKLTNRIILLLTALIVVLLIFKFPAQTKILYQDFFDRMTNEHELEDETPPSGNEGSDEGSGEGSGESDIPEPKPEIDINLSGRDAIWKQAFDNFVENPLFGAGIGHLKASETHILAESFFPYLAHNTLLQLLGSGGLFALLAYLIYRMRTILVFIRRPSTGKSFLALICLFLVLTSLVDNFLFYIYPTFHYTIALAFACKMHRERESQ